MYEIRTTDGSPVYYQNDADYTAFNIECYTAKGDAGYLKFTIPKSNPAWGTLVTRQTLLELKLDGESLGIYEVREVSHDINFSESVYAVGELAWLYDSIQPQAEFHDISPRDFLRALITVHNEQCPDHQFQVGAVDVVDSNDSLYRYTNRETTLDDIRDKLVDRLGGQLKLRHVGDVRYIDYLTETTYGQECTQRVYFGENMLDYSDSLTVSDICSSVIPLGCRLDEGEQIGNLENRLTVESVNDGKDYVENADLVERFGKVRSVQIWDDVTVPLNLLQKAQEWLTSTQYEHMHLTVRAIDLSLTSAQFERFRTGDYVIVQADPYGLKRRYSIQSRTYHPDAPESDTLEIGDDVRVSYTAEQRVQTKQIEKVAEEQTSWLADSVANVNAMLTGARGGYKKTVYDDEGRWLAEYIMDSMDEDTAQVVKLTTVDGTAYSQNGIDGPYETAIMANGTILGKFIEAHSVTAEKISQDYTKSWEDADKQTLNTARTEFKAADAEISARVSQVEIDANNVKTDLAAEIKVRAEQISQTVKRGQINSTIKQTAETIYIESNKFGWNSTNSSLATDGTLTAKNATFTNCTVNGNVTTELGNLRTVVNQGGISFYYKANNSWMSTGKITPNYSLVNNTTTYTGLLRIASTKSLGLVNISDYAVSLSSMDKSSAATKQAGVGTTYIGGVATAYMNTWNSSSQGSVIAKADGVSIGVTGKGTSSPPSTGVSLTKNTVSIYANSGSSKSHAEMSIANGKINFYQDGMSTYTGSIYLTYGNGGKIYLTVKGGLIYGWTL